MLMLHNLSSFVHRLLASQVQKLNAHVRRLRNLWKHLHKFLSRSNIFWPFYFLCERFASSLLSHHCQSVTDPVSVAVDVFN